MHSSNLKFKPINLDQYQDLCIRFRADSFVCSFGSVEQFYQADGNGAERYLKWLKQRIAEIPNSCVHLWEGERIIGQIEMGRWKQDANVGYINLFYLIPEFRGQGLGQHLDQSAAHFFKHLGCQSARLSVSPANRGAMCFYLKHGWVDLGQREDAPEVHYLEKTFN
jgi:GNAT superfamily N-acetyltransferase